MIIHSTTLDTMEKVIAIYGGTTWVRLDDKFLVGAGTSYEVNATGGSASITPSGTVGGHTLTVSEIPSHSHSLYAVYANIAGTGPSGSSYKISGGQTYYCNYASSTGAAGGGDSHSHGFTGTSHTNLPPYKAVYIWERTV